MKIQFVAKYQKIEGETLWRHLKKIEKCFEKIVGKKRKMRILKQSHSAEKAERGDPFDFLKIQFVAKYQKIEGETLWRHLKKIEKCFEKIVGKKRKMRILKQSHSAEKAERGDPFDFLKIQFVAKYQKIEGGPFGDILKKIEKCFEKIVEKNEN